MNKLFEPDIDALLRQLEHDHIIVRERTVEQLANQKERLPEIIAALELLLRRESYDNVKDVANDAVAKLKRRLNAVRLDPSQTTSAQAPLFLKPEPGNLHVPNLCVRCGSESVDDSFLLRIPAVKRLMRFLWQRRETVDLSVPVCATCKETLNRHSFWSVFLYYLTDIPIFLGLLWFSRSLWMAVVAIWAGALAGRLVMSIYRYFVRSPLGAVWADMVDYEEGYLTFRSPQFQAAFVKANQMVDQARSV